MTSASLVELVPTEPDRGGTITVIKREIHLEIHVFVQDIATSTGVSGAAYLSEYEGQ